MDLTVVIEGQKIDEPAIVRPHLPTHDEQVDSAHARVFGKHILKTPLGIERKRLQAIRPAVGHSPDCHLNSQLNPPDGVDFMMPPGSDIPLGTGSSTLRETGTVQNP